MLNKNLISHLCSILWVVALMLSPVQPAYAAPVITNQVAVTPAMLQFTSGGHVLGFNSSGMLAANGSHALTVDFMGANPVQPQSVSPASPEGSSHKAEGQASPLGKVSYTNLWDGINLEYSTDSGSVYTTTYTLSPGANPANIRLHYNTPLTINHNGGLQITFETGNLNESAPIAWQEIHGQRVDVPVIYHVEGQQVGFTLGTYDPAYALTIDPSLIWNTFLGGGGGIGIAMDGSGNLYIVGTRGGGGGSFGNDAIVVKFNPAGAMVWNTSFGYDGQSDEGYSIAVDGSGNVYATGKSKWPWGTPVRAFSAGSAGEDAFVVKLNSSGTLVWNTFLGSDTDDSGNGIAVDSAGNIYVNGYSVASTWGSPVRAYTSGFDTFTAKLNPSGVLIWNTFLGGSGNDFGYGIALDGSGNIYVTGLSAATWSNPLRSFSGGDYDAFIAKLNSDGVLTWNTFLGGSGRDSGNDIAVDGSGDVVVVGDSTNTWGTPVQAYTGGHDIFDAKLSPSGALLWNTFLGGSADDFGYGIAVDNSGYVYTTGYSDAAWGNPLRAFTKYGTHNDGFAARLNPSGALQATTFLGGSGYDDCYDIVVDGSDNVAVTGYSSVSWGAPLNSVGRTFVAKVDLTPPSVVSSVRASANPSNAASVNFTVTFSKVVTGVDKTDFTLTTTGLTGASVTSVNGTGTTYSVAVNTGSGNGTLQLNVVDNDNVIDATGNPLGGTGAGNGNFTGGETYTISNRPPTAATLVSPLTTTTSHTPVFIWSKVTASTLYRLWIKNSSDTWVVQNLYAAKNICGATNCAVTPTTSLPYGTYTWYIQTLTATQNGAWAGHSFTVAVAVPGMSTLVAPKGTTHIAKPTFIWSKDPVATLYRLWLKNSSGTWVFQNLYAGKNICGATNCAMVSPVTLPNGAYTWYIQTLTNTQNGQWSAQAITVSVPDFAPSGDGDSRK